MAEPAVDRGKTLGPPVQFTVEELTVLLVGLAAALDHTPPPGVSVIVEGLLNKLTDQVETITRSTRGPSR